MVSQNHFKLTGAVALKLLLCVILVLGVMQFPILGLGKTAKADGAVQLSTQYPGITVKAGSNPSFQLMVENNSGTSQVFDLSIDSQLPDGWSASFTGGGNPVSTVYVQNANSAGVVFNVTIPDSAVEGPNKIDISAKGRTGISSFLELGLTVTKQDINQGTFTTQYSALKGSSNTTFKFSTTINNSSGVDQSYILGADAPAGWTVTFAPSYQTQQIASASVAAGKTQGIDVSITPAPNTAPGNNTITCSAISANSNLTVELNVGITGTYKMALTTPSGQLNADAYAGRETAIALQVVNAGSADITNLSLSASAPGDWNVSFDPPNLSNLAAGQIKTVTAKITTPPNAIVGDYMVDITASSANVAALSSFRITVNASTTWGIVAIVVILLLVAGLIVMFTRFGRR